MKTSVSGRAFTIGALIVAALIAGVLSFYASGHPDGLEYVAGETGFINAATDHATGDWPLADYAVRGIDNLRISGGLAGIIGCAATFCVAMVLTSVGRRRP